MDLEVLGNFSIYAFVSAINGFILSFFNKEIDKYESSREKYYEWVLLPFYNNYTKDNHLNVKKILRE